MQNRGEHCLPGYFSAAYGDEYTLQSEDSPPLCSPGFGMLCDSIYRRVRQNS